MNTIYFYISPLDSKKINVHVIWDECILLIKKYMKNNENRQGQIQSTFPGMAQQRTQHLGC